MPRQTKTQQKVGFKVANPSKTTKPLTPFQTAYRAVKKVAPFPINAVMEGITAITGVGDYTVEGNSLGGQLGFRGTATSSIPQFNAATSNRVCHRECLGTVVSPGSAFTSLKKLTFNPSDHFPLATVYSGQLH